MTDLSLQECRIPHGFFLGLDKFPDPPKLHFSSFALNYEQAAKVLNAPPERRLAVAKTFNREYVPATFNREYAR
jgi:hypothetical protein